MKDLKNKWRNYEKAIIDYITTRREDYFTSNCYQSLRNRHTRLRDAYDMRYHNNRSTVRASNTWMSKIAVPLTREAMLSRRALTLGSFKNDPILTVYPGPGTGHDKAVVAQGTLQSNFRNGMFRQRALHAIINDASKYGVGVCTVCYENRVEKAMRTVEKKLGDSIIGYERTLVPRAKSGVINHRIHFLNYFQNPHIADPELSDYRGYIERWQLSDFMAYTNGDDNYIKSNVEKALKQAKENIAKDSNYYAYSESDYKGIGIDITHWYGVCNIKGNEDDLTTYYAEFAGDNIIRFQENPNDDDIVPIWICTFDRRDEFWWGNTDSESVVPMENYLNLALNMTADDGLRKLQNWIFYDKGLGFSPEDLNNRAKNGGFVPFEQKPGMQKSARDLFHYVDFPTSSPNLYSYLSSEAKEAAQRVLPRKDFSRRAMQGGPQNSTATAAVMMDQEGDTMESYYLTEFSYGLINCGNVNLTMLQQYSPEKFIIRPNKFGSQVVEKWQILGDFEFVVQSSLTENKLVQATKLINTMTAIQNFKGAGVDQSWMNVDMAPLIRSWLKKLDLGVDIDEVYRQPQMAMAGQQQMPMGGPPPTPAPPANMPPPNMVPPQGRPVAARGPLQPQPGPPNAR